jgi:hypothetical protein
MSEPSEEEIQRLRVRLSTSGRVTYRINGEKHVAFSTASDGAKAWGMLRDADEVIASLSRQLAEAQHSEALALKARDHYDEERREAVQQEAGWKARAELAEKELAEAQQERSTPVTAHHDPRCDDHGCHPSCQADDDPMPRQLVACPRCELRFGVTQGGADPGGPEPSGGTK